MQESKVSVQVISKGYKTSIFTGNLVPPSVTRRSYTNASSRKVFIQIYTPYENYRGIFPISDLKSLNRFLWVSKFCMESARNQPKLFSDKNNFLYQKTYKRPIYISLSSPYINAFCILLWETNIPNSSFPVNPEFSQKYLPISCFSVDTSIHVTGYLNSLLLKDFSAITLSANVQMTIQFLQTFWPCNQLSKICPLAPIPSEMCGSNLE